MARALRIVETYEYVLAADRDLPEAEQTVWQLKRLSYSQRHHLEDMLIKDQYGAAKDAVLRACIKGWRNWRDDNGTQIEYATGSRTTLLGVMVTPVAETVLDRITPEDAWELAGELMGGSRLGNDDRKN